MRCPNCGEGYAVKKGKRKNKFEEIQIYLCKTCNKKFISGRLNNKSYKANIILNAISYYNLGNTIDETTKLIRRRFKVKVSEASVHNWLNEFKTDYNFYKIRDSAIAKYRKDLICSKIFKHRGLTYNYKYHKAKLNLFSSDFGYLKNYLINMDKNFPHKFFEDDERCSRVIFNNKISHRHKKSYACRLARLILKSTDDNKKRHNLIEEFMLCNDTATVAVEVPVWFWDKKLNAGICGHIDILQIRNGLIYILDYKPAASKENLEKVKSQLYLYALGLSFRTGIKLEKFRCAWFDDESYIEFNPEEVKSIGEIKCK